MSPGTIARDRKKRTRSLVLQSFLRVPSHCEYPLTCPGARVDGPPMAPDLHQSDTPADFPAGGQDPGPAAATAAAGPMGPRAAATAPGAQPGAAERARAELQAQGLPVFVTDPEALATWAHLLG